MKISYKMKKTVERLVKKYGFAEKDISYGVEALIVNRHGNGYYDYAEIFEPITRLHFVIAFDGKIAR